MNMEAERRRQLMLAGLAVVLVIVVYRAWPTTSPASLPSSNQKASGTSGAASDRTRKDSTAPATDVHLEALEAERPKPGPSERNLFRFREKQPPPPTGRGPFPTQPDAAVPPPVPSPPQPPPVPPITLKFIGLMKQEGEGKPRIAILSDGSGLPLYGKEGDLVAGRYRILKIGEESIELAYADGRGRQTIRLTGSS
jgi:hypothetical protein